MHPFGNWAYGSAGSGSSAAARSRLAPPAADAGAGCVGRTLPIAARASVSRSRQHDDSRVRDTSAPAHGSSNVAEVPRTRLDNRIHRRFQRHLQFQSRIQENLREVPARIQTSCARRTRTLELRKLPTNCRTYQVFGAPTSIGA